MSKPFRKTVEERIKRDTEFKKALEKEMSNVPYTDANREKLAEAVVENMDIKDMIQALYEQEVECYEQCEDTFQELWHNHYGDEDE